MPSVVAVLTRKCDVARRVQLCRYRGHGGGVGGRYLPSLPLAFAIARFFDMTVDKMFDPADEEEGA
jgi:hypothetical protein